MKMKVMVGVVLEKNFTGNNYFLKPHRIHHQSRYFDLDIFSLRVIWWNLEITHFIWEKTVLSAATPPNLDFIWEPHSMEKKCLSQIFRPTQKKLPYLPRTFPGRSYTVIRPSEAAEMY